MSAFRQCRPVRSVSLGAGESRKELPSDAVALQCNALACATLCAVPRRADSERPSQQPARTQRRGGTAVVRLAVVALVFRFSAGRGASELAPARVSGTAGCGGCRCCAKRSPRQSRRQAPCSCEAGRSADNPRFKLRSSTTSRKPATCCARSSVGTTTTAKQYGEHASTRLRSGWHHVRQPHAPARKSRLAIRDRTLHTGQQVADGSTLSRAS